MERNERAWRGCDAVGCHAVSFYYLWYGAIYMYKRQYTDKHVTLNKCMCMRAGELRKFWHLHILKLLFLSIFCWYIDNKSWFNFIWGATAPPPPPPTSTPVHTSTPACTYSSIVESLLVVFLSFYFTSLMSAVVLNHVPT